MTKYFLTIITLTCALVSFVSIAATEKDDIDKVLNSFHQAAADAKSDVYFNLLTDDAIFLGTDASERWTKDEFKAFVVPYFSKGTGWLYTPTQRDTSLIQDGRVAFFDELLFSESYGVCRGSGVLYKTKAGWKIAQYNLSIPMPNGLAKALVKQIKEFGLNK